MILVDSGVLIDYLRTGDAKLDHLFRSLPVAVCGLTRAEILHGARNGTNRQHLLTLLNTFAQVPIREAAWDAVGEHLATLRARGITVPFADAVLAAVAIDHDVELWARDAHFSLRQTVLPQLKLFVEPP